MLLLPLQVYAQTNPDNDKFQDLFEAKIIEIVDGELITRSYYFVTPEEAERFEQIMQNSGDTTNYQVEIIGEETIDGTTKFVTKTIPATFIKYTDKPQKLRPEGYIPYTTPKIQSSLQEIIDSGVDRIDIRIQLKDTPKLPTNFLQMSDEEQRIAIQEKYTKIEIMQQDLVDYTTNNDGIIIRQLEFINSVYANVPVELITELENRDDILTMAYYDKDAKSTLMSNEGNSFEADDTTHNVDIENLWSIKLVHEDTILDFDITSEDNKPVVITIPNYIVLEEFDITVNDKIVDYSIAQGDDKSLLRTSTKTTTYTRRIPR